MKEVYQKYVEVHTGKPTMRSYEKTARAYNKIYGKFLPQNKDIKILDVGCGPGYFLWYLQKQGYSNILGIDLSEQELRICREFVTNRVLLADAFVFLKRRKDYDLIVLNHLLEHLNRERLIKLLQLCYKALRRGGRLFAQVPNMSNPFSLSTHYIDITHQTGFTENSLKEVLRVCGFKKLWIEGAFPFGSWKSDLRHALGKLTHVLIKVLFILQGYGVPKILDPKLILVAEK